MFGDWVVARGEGCIVVEMLADWPRRVDWNAMSLSKRDCGLKWVLRRSCSALQNRTWANRPLCGLFLCGGISFNNLTTQPVQHSDQLHTEGCDYWIRRPKNKRHFSWLERRTEVFFRGRRKGCPATSIGMGPSLALG
ncbi:hypothetical protein DL95DRAFT_18150 [Leptodontidium sp. 2 PMI_412]|nr:hypothetical protein DL95DRAFT_18150 [Leptodontidium sp. 2 PMI_412]